MFVFIYTRNGWDFNSVSVGVGFFGSVKKLDSSALLRWYVLKSGSLTKEQKSENVWKWGM